MELETLLLGMPNVAVSTYIYTLFLPWRLVLGGLEFEENPVEEIAMEENPIWSEKRVRMKSKAVTSNCNLLIPCSQNNQVREMRKLFSSNQKNEGYNLQIRALLYIYSLCMN